MIIYSNYGYSAVYYRYIVDILLTKSIHDPFMKGLLSPERVVNFPTTTGVVRKQEQKNNVPYKPYSSESF